MTSTRPTSGRAPAETWTTRRLLAWMTGHFQHKGIDSPRLTAEFLLAHVIGCDRMRLYMEVDRPAQPLELASLRDLVTRAAASEPVQYLVGEAWFFGRPYAVGPAVLIPRPSTETLVEHVLQRCRAAPGRATLLADVGTGCGCIAVSLAARLPEAHVVATDVSADALEVAAANAGRHGVADRIEFLAGDCLEPLRSAAGSRRYDVICSNPPYVSDAEWAQVAPNGRDHEPPLALRGGPDGLDVVRPLVAGAGALLEPGGQLVVEIADAHRDAALGLAAEAGFDNALVLKDHEGLWRVLAAEQPASP